MVKAGGEGGGGGGGGGGPDKCKRGGVKLTWSNAGARLYTDVEDGKEGEDDLEGEEEGNIDDMFDQIAKGSQVNDKLDESQTEPAQWLCLQVSTCPIPEN